MNRVLKGVRRVLRAVRLNRPFCFFLFLGFVGLPLTVQALTPGTAITNTGSVSYVLDGAGYEQSASATLIADPAAGNSPPYDIELVGATVPANVPGVSVGPLSVSDPDVADSHTFTVSDARFEVVADELRLSGASSLPAGSSVSVIVTAADPERLTFSKTFVVTSEAGTPSNASISIRVAGSGDGLDIPAAACLIDGAEVSAGAVTDTRGDPLVLPGQQTLSAVSVIKSGNTAFLLVEDPAADSDPLARDALEVTISVSSGDVLTLRLTETAESSSAFAGYVQTVRGGADLSDCALQVGTDDALRARYQPAAGGTLDARATVDPLGRVFAAATGQPVGNVSVRLINADTGQLAVVFGDDGRAPFPPVVRTGSTVTDGAGVRYPFPAGRFRFPYVPPGRYRIEVDGPARFGFPSAAADAVLQNLPGAPFVLHDGSRGEAFAVAQGGALHVDVPLDVQAVEPTPATLEVFQVTAGAGEQSLPVPADACADVATLRTGELALPASLAVRGAEHFARGDAIAVRLTDPDQDVDPFAADTVSVTAEAGTDLQRVTLVETGASTGVFTGLVNTGGTTAAADDCRLDAGPGTPFAFRYEDPNDQTDIAFARGELDPVFRVYSSATGELLDGALVRLLNAGTGALAEPLSVDGVTRYPAVLISGGAVEDAGGTGVEFAPGTFYIPALPPGRYTLEVIPPGDFAFPSTRSDAEIAAPEGSVQRVAAGSRGEVFEVQGAVPVAFDVPLDPLGRSLFLSKTASTDVVAPGEFVQYLVTLQPGVASAVTGLQILDDLPRGFRYQRGSARLDGVKVADPSVSPDGQRLTFDLSGVALTEAAELRYVTEVTAVAEEGGARNRVTATGADLATVNVAFADVLVRDDLFATEGFVLGRVSDACGGAGDGIAGVRVLLEDGTYAITDDDGRYHFEGIAAGTHVVQLDPTTIPAGFEVTPCLMNSRGGGAVGARFTDLSEGGLWQENFRLQPKPREDRWSTQLHARAHAGVVEYQLDVVLGDMAAERGSVTVMLDDLQVFEAGSGMFREAPVEPRVSDGVLTFPLPAMEPRGRYLLTFASRTTTQGQPVTAKASTWLSTPFGKYRSEVVESTVQPASADQRLYADIQDIDVTGVVSSSEVASVRVSLPPVDAASELPYELPEVAEAEAPDFGLPWLQAETAEAELVWPPEGFNPRTPSVPVVIKHPTDWRPSLIVDGELVGAVNFEGTLSDPGRNLSVSRWHNVPVSERDSRIEVQLLDGQGNLRERLARDVHFGQIPARAELVPEASYLVADGVHPPMLAVRLYDRAGFPARPGLSGEFAVRAPYQALDKARRLEVVDQTGGIERYQVRQEGIAYIQLEPTADAGNVTLAFQFDRHRVETLRARLSPGERDWVVVGLAESSIAAENMSGAADDDDVSHDGRVAFYAKGVVRGEWLLTAAYDSDKADRNEIQQAIDPNRFYTLYGDGTEQRHDAQSQRKLYFKLERRDLAIEAGDFDTGFERSELARYERRLNGVRADYFGDRVSASAFASDTDQRLVLDTLPGDGTSGIYRLSRNRLVANSELVRVVTRDRFHSERVLEEQSLTRHVDYTIDYDAGHLIFKQPVLSQDLSFNPITIEVRYEVAGNQGGDQLVSGARAAWRLDEQGSEVGATYINDEAALEAGRMLAADAHFRIGETGELDVEFAATDRDTVGEARAWLAEYRHRTEQLAGRAYFRQVDSNFGLGQQVLSENDTRKFGVEGEWTFTPELALRGELFRQETMAQGGERQVALVEGRYRKGRFNTHAGLQRVEETTASGEARASDLLRLGAGTTVLGGRMLLRGDTELALSSDDEVSDYPSRATVGAEFTVLDDVALIAEHEIGMASGFDTHDTRFGVRARPWTGSRLESTLGRATSEQGERLFATTGLIQQFRLNERWTMDVGADRVQTLSGAPRAPAASSFNPSQPPANGSYDNDFTAAFVGAGYRRETWSGNARIEFHAGEQADKWNVLAGAARQLEAGKALSASVQWLSEHLEDGGERETGRVRMGVAWRPADGWMVLNRLDLEAERTRSFEYDTRTTKLVENLHLNRRWERQELSLHLGAKLVAQQFDGDQYDGFTGLVAADYRIDLNERWDLGAHAGARRSFASGVTDSSAGVSVGRSVFSSAWVSVGYNFSGFSDDDFANADYRREGAYVKFRARVDQHMVGRFLSFVGWRGETEPPAGMLARGR